MANGKKGRAKAPPKNAPARAPESEPGGDLAREPDAGGTDLAVVGIGASAGGLAAFEAFFSGLPADRDPGMAFVLVQHLAPDHKSILADLIRRQTRMQVFEVEDDMPVRPNCAYIIPPNHDMALLHGRLQLLEPSAPRGQRLPIDFFFRSLAFDQRERAIGIVLSGTGSDGTLGVRAIKGEGGMVMAQALGTTEFDGMPRSAIATGLVDYELPPAEMPARLIDYVARSIGRLPKSPAALSGQGGKAMEKIFVVLRARTGHDFSGYKPSTVDRRIERRMAIHQIETIDDYAEFLQRTPAEVEALFRDLLIGVTQFFRDPEAFRTLEREVIPGLFAGKPAGSPVRVWSVGCATGEEAYSIAILLQEKMEELKASFAVQVFATDIDRAAIATARMGIYPASIATDMSPERLARFFSLEPDGGGYRVHKGIRDLLIFSEQDVIRDPPFSKLDLVCCRNLLIYLGVELQKKIIPLFHYALHPGGILFLGSSEGVGEAGDLFAVLDRKAKLFRRKDDLEGRERQPLRRLLQHRTTIERVLPRAVGKAAYPEKLQLRELTEQALLEQVVPACVLVNAQGVMLYQHGRTGQFLEPAPGEAGINNILKMAREGLRPGLTTSLHRAVNRQEVVRTAGLRVKANGHFIRVDVTVRPLSAGGNAAGEAPLFLVLLEEAPAVDPEPAKRSAATEDAPEPNARIAALEQELRAKEEYLQTTHEELETSNDELRSTLQEMQSVNEELQSSNEELETSKEELQSVNEELATVNNELQTKVADLSQTNNDMNNLLAGTGIATVFVDHQLRILRFTPTASQLINLIAGDVGRPVGHIVSNLVGYDDLVADVQEVLDTLAPKEAQVQTAGGRWFTMRIRPYRTLDNVIEGAVVTFVDVTETKLAQDALAKANERALRGRRKRAN